MDPTIAALLGVVEGVTEYLPVSSTGHLILASSLLGLEHDTATSAFEIAIQLGAVLAVVGLYRALLVEHAVGLLQRRRESIRLLAALLAAFAPIAVVGLLLHRAIKEHLFGPTPVAIALIVGGFVMIAVERTRQARGTRGCEGLEHITIPRAIAIGLGQCVALCPGASRSMCTIVSAQLTGLSTATAAQFSFLLALPTLGSATLYEMYTARDALAESVGHLNLAIGLGVSCLVAWIVIAGFVRYLQHRGLEAFGYYRIALGLAVFAIVRSV